MDTKLTLNIILPGRVMYSVKEATKVLQKPVRNNKGKVLKKKGQVVLENVEVPSFEYHNTFTITLNEDGKGVSQKVMVRKCRPASQVINMTEDAYNAFVAPFPAPTGYPSKNVPWEKLTKNQRIKWHCERIAESLGGSFGGFQVLD